MKSLLSWMTDPIVHLVVVVIFVVHVAMNLQPEPELDLGNNEISMCRKCGLVHGAQIPCSVFRVNLGSSLKTR